MYTTVEPNLAYIYNCKFPKAVFSSKLWGKHFLFKEEEINLFYFQKIRILSLKNEQKLINKKLKIAQKSWNVLLSDIAMNKYGFKFLKYKMKTKPFIIFLLQF